ncbi:hypothetical protein SDC9_177855 [bioreactor metagenome]|uniref:Uncharacterized protein n=1 Tax=bioreactor metagenome TaxID=1076179 RepID=A0A645H216_9ZZZZ
MTKMLPNKAKCKHHKTQWNNDVEPIQAPDKIHSAEELQNQSGGHRNVMYRKHNLNQQTALRI